MMNEDNPSGNVANSQAQINILIIAVSVSVAVAVKRFLIGLHLGRQTFSKSFRLLLPCIWPFLLTAS
jgi:hypothetical protein